MKIIDRYLNKITMYRLTLYYLIALILFAIIFSFFSLVPFSGLNIILSCVIILLSCYIANSSFAYFFEAITNVESVLITALILVLIFPITLPYELLAIVLVSFLAMGSKYLLTVNKRHIANPAAIAVLLISFLFPNHVATWWVGTPAMLLPVLIGGLLLLRKVQKAHMVISFLLTYFILSAIAVLFHGGGFMEIAQIWKSGIFASALLFFAFVMLTEPFTSPHTKKFQNIYAVITGILYATPLLRLTSIVFTPEMALFSGNIFAYIVKPKYRLLLTLKEKIKISPDTYLFVFHNVVNFKFTPGQYMEWTLPHKNADSRGIRRYFSIASAPHEDIMLAIKFYSPSSSYKRELLTLKTGDNIIASNLAGDFVFKESIKRPSVFIAGGVGIAPFRSILEDIVQKREIVDIVVLFTNRKHEDIIFDDTLKKAQALGVKIIYVLTDTTVIPLNFNGRTGYLTENSIIEDIPDYKTRYFYISGPQLMVQNFKDILKNAGVKNEYLKVDFFPGYSEVK